MHLFIFLKINQIKRFLINSTHIKKYHEGWERKANTALIAINTNNQAVGAV